MKIIIVDRKIYSTYKEFYIHLYKDLNGKSIPDREDCENLEYDANMLDEFLWYCQDRNIHFIFKNFDLDKIKNYKNYENYQWNIILEVIQDFVKKYPNNQLEFINED